LDRWTGPGLHEQSGGELYGEAKLDARLALPSRFTADLSDFDQSTLNTVYWAGREFSEPVITWISGVPGSREIRLGYPFRKEGGAGVGGVHELVLIPAFTTPKVRLFSD